MLSNVKLAIKSSQIEDLYGVMHKATEMEEVMLETYVDPEIILGKVQTQIDTLAISNQGAYTSRNVENQGTRNNENRGIGGGILQGVRPNVKNDPKTTQETKQRL